MKYTMQDINIRLAELRDSMLYILMEKNPDEHKLNCLVELHDMLLLLRDKCFRMEIGECKEMSILIYELGLKCPYYENGGVCDGSCVAFIDYRGVK